MTPGSTYRLQLHAEFPFERAAGIAPYLARLGVSHLYASPVLQAARGSRHGYDVVDPSRLDDERGGEAGFRALCATLQQHGLGSVLDIVPNHMAAAGRSNGWWWDVLTNGAASEHAKSFDIDWQMGEPAQEPSVLLPILGDHYGRVLEAGELRLARTGGALLVTYHEHELPLAPQSVRSLLAAAGERARSERLLRLAAEFASPPPGTSRAALESRLAEACAADAALARAIDAELAAVTADHDRLDALLQQQNYRLAFWRTDSEDIGYRRFFDVTTLVGVRVEDPEVFEATHRVVLDLLGDGLVQGLRIDHVDGLRDPRGYLDRLHAAAPSAWVVVEKILAVDERLPADWPVAGTSGYDFLVRTGFLFVDEANEAAMTRCYERFTGETAAFADVVHESKLVVMAQDLRAEIDWLLRLLQRVCREHRRHRDHTRRGLRDAIVAVLANFGVYRSYVQPGAAPARIDEARVETAVALAGKRRPDLDGELLQFLGELILQRHAGEAAMEFALRVPQVAAAVMAKGVEDTAFYRYHRLISLNEVGGDPSVFGRPVADFHRDMAAAAADWPHGMLTLSTHDTKRSGDVRARLHLLSELPELWEAAVTQLEAHVERHRRGPWPDKNTEYLLYQTLVGAWPIDADRACTFVQKATREAKVHTSWVSPDAGYDDAVQAFVRDVLGDAGFVALLEDFLARHRLVERGRLVSLAQTTLLLTCPGVPDLYQGSELWDLSLVDPDNRRPVDFALRERLLAATGAAPPDVTLADDHEGRTKLWLVQRLLADRRERPAAYLSTDYEPLPLRGAKAAHAVAFARGDLATVVPRLCVGLGGDFGDTATALPAGNWTNVLTGAAVGGGDVALAELLRDFPVAVLRREEG